MLMYISDEVIVLEETLRLRALVSKAVGLPTEQVKVSWEAEPSEGGSKLHPVVTLPPTDDTELQGKQRELVQVVTAHVLKALMARIKAL